MLKHVQFVGVLQYTTLHFTRARYMFPARDTSKQPVLQILPHEFLRLQVSLAFHR